MDWLLIVLTLVSGLQPASHIDVIEFGSEEACSAATLRIYSLTDEQIAQLEQPPPLPDGVVMVTPPRVPVSRAAFCQHRTSAP